MTLLIFMLLPQTETGQTIEKLRHVQFFYGILIMECNYCNIPKFSDRAGQTVQTKIRLLLEEQSDQGLHCLQFPLHLLDALP